MNLKVIIDNITNNGSVIVLCIVIVTVIGVSGFLLAKYISGHVRKQDLYGAWDKFHDPDGIDDTPKRYKEARHVHEYYLIPLPDGCTSIEYLYQVACMCISNRIRWYNRKLDEERKKVSLTEFNSLEVQTIKNVESLELQLEEIAKIKAEMDSNPFR